AAHQSCSPSLIVTLLLSGRIRGDSVSQMEGQVTMSEGALLTINCTYSATTSGYPTLFWYVQYPGEGLQLLLKAVKANDKVSNKGFEATHNKEAMSFHLEKASVQESDSAVYYCVLGDTVAETAGGAEVCLNHPPAVGTKAGNGHPRQEVGRSVAAHVWGWKENTQPSLGS
uniref:Ig-like domain-containing protein n=1 Tax=Urocitellus parryii TaxID=9999 RepID=A0A8D2GTC5_UROPR